MEFLAELLASCPGKAQLRGRRRRAQKRCRCRSIDLFKSNSTLKVLSVSSTETLRKARLLKDSLVAERILSFEMKARLRFSTRNLQVFQTQKQLHSHSHVSTDIQRHNSNLQICNVTEITSSWWICVQRYLTVTIVR